MHSNWMEEKKYAETAVFNFVSKLPLMPWKLLCADKHSWQLEIEFMKFEILKISENEYSHQ